MSTIELIFGGMVTHTVLIVESTAPPTLEPGIYMIIVDSDVLLSVQCISSCFGLDENIGIGMLHNNNYYNGSVILCMTSFLAN